MSSVLENIERRFSGRERVGLPPVAHEGGKRRRNGEETMKLFSIPSTGDICFGDWDFVLLKNETDTVSAIEKAKLSNISNLNLTFDLLGKIID